MTRKVLMIFLATAHIAETGMQLDTAACPFVLLNDTIPYGMCADYQYFFIHLVMF